MFEKNRILKFKIQNKEIGQTREKLDQPNVNRRTPAGHAWPCLVVKLCCHDRHDRVMMTLCAMPRRAYSLVVCASQGSFLAGNFIWLGLIWLHQ